VQRITTSNKLNDQEKQDKLKALAEVNQEVSAKFDSFQKTKLKAAIVQNGGTANPKQETSRTSPDSEQNEPVSFTI
jgi:hypothetical protein